MTFWCITSYFNPLSYKRRFHNYQTFRKYLELPLLTVEWSPKANFQLEKQDAELLIQVSGGDIIWQKERLLNIAVQSLPENCTKVAWIDCDVIFPSKNWYLDAEKMLDNVAIVQLFQTVYDLSPENIDGFGNLNFIGKRKSIISIYKSGIHNFGHNSLIRNDVYKRPQPGMAWAARKEILTDIGFYDANIVGGADSTISHTLFNDEKYLSSRMSEAHFSHYNIWGKKLFAKVNFQFDYLNTDIYHLWHGSLKNRLYRERLSWLIEADFNPYHDICLTDSGCWQWSSEKPDLHQKIAEYFELRAEDG